MEYIVPLWKEDFLQKTSDRKKFARFPWDWLRIIYFANKVLSLSHNIHDINCDQKCDSYGFCDIDLCFKTQMRELTEPPRVWNAREAFMEQVYSSPLWKYLYGWTEQ